jgi:hypothetical protein
LVVLWWLLSDAKLAENISQQIIGGNLSCDFA